MQQIGRNSLTAQHNRPAARRRSRGGTLTRLLLRNKHKQTNARTHTHMHTHQIAIAFYNVKHARTHTHTLTQASSQATTRLKFNLIHFSTWFSFQLDSCLRFSDFNLHLLFTVKTSARHKIASRIKHSANADADAAIPLSQTLCAISFVCVYKWRRGCIWGNMLSSQILSHLAALFIVIDTCSRQLLSWSAPKGKRGITLFQISNRTS